MSDINENSTNEEAHPLVPIENVFASLASNIAIAPFSADQKALIEPNQAETPTNQQLSDLVQQTLQMAGQKPILARPPLQQWQIKAPMEMQLKRELAPAARNNASSRDARILNNSFKDIYMLRQQHDSRGVGSLAF